MRAGYSSRAPAHAYHIRCERPCASEKGRTARRVVAVDGIPQAGLKFASAERAARLLNAGSLNVTGVPATASLPHNSGEKREERNEKREQLPFEISLYSLPSTLFSEAAS